MIVFPFCQNSLGFPAGVQWKWWKNWQTETCLMQHNWYIWSAIHLFENILGTHHWVPLATKQNIERSVALSYQPFVIKIILKYFPPSICPFFCSVAHSCLPNMLYTSPHPSTTVLHPSLTYWKLFWFSRWFCKYSCRPVQMKTIKSCNWISISDCISHFLLD